MNQKFCDPKPGVFFTKDYIKNVIPEYVENGYDIRVIFSANDLKKYKPSFVSNKICFVYEAKNINDAKAIELFYNKIFSILQDKIKPAIVIKSHIDIKKNPKGSGRKTVKIEFVSSEDEISDDIKDNIVSIESPCQMKNWVGVDYILYNMKVSKTVSDQNKRERRIVDQYKKVFGGPNSPKLFVIRNSK